MAKKTKNETKDLNLELRSKCSGEYWINLWSPKSFEDVRVSKNIKLEFKTWLEEAYSCHSEKASLLLLVGPTGCGKTALVNCTCKVLNISIVRWEIPLDLEYNDVTAVFYESQTKKFEDFLSASARYQSVLLGMESRKVIVVEDFPQAFFRNPENLYKIIKKHSMNSRTPVIFTCDENVEHKLFSPSNLFELKVKQLRIREMSPRELFKVLNRVRTLYPKIVNVSTEYLKELSKESSGDCRSALLKLYCHIFGVNREEIRPRNTLGRIRENKKQNNISIEEKPKQKGRDDDLGIFHLLGQMLYPKRNCASEPRMFKHDPNEIAQAVQRHTNIVLLAHENYLSTFGDISDISAAAAYLSEVDILNKAMLDKDNLQKIAFSIMTYGLMLSNNHVIRKWNPWRKSKHLEVISANEKLRHKIENEVPDYNIHTRIKLMELIPIVRSCNLVSRVS